MKVRRVQLSPSILAADFTAVDKALELIESNGLDRVHLDVMDGSFVPNISFGPKFIKDMRKLSGITFDAHLMISSPERYIKEFADAGCDSITVHREATVHLNRILMQIKDEGKEAGVAINPSTSISEIENDLGIIDYVLIMSVNPGFGGQSFIPSSLKKISALSEIRDKEGYDFKIMVDGGINLNTAESVKEAGADILISGEAFFGAEDTQSFIKEMIR